MTLKGLLIHDTHLHSSSAHFQPSRDNQNTWILWGTIYVRTLLQILFVCILKHSKWDPWTPSWPPHQIKSNLCRRTSQPWTQPHTHTHSLILHLMKVLNIPLCCLVCPSAFYIKHHRVLYMCPGHASIGPDPYSLILGFQEIAPRFGIH